MSKDESSLATRRVITLFSGWPVVLILMVFPFMAVAAPESLQICVQVLPDGDANPEEGGEWKWYVADQAGDLTDSTMPVVHRTEASENNTECSSSYGLSDTSREIAIYALTPSTFEWSGNADGFPAWQITDSTGSTVYKAGSGRNATLSADEFSTIPEETLLKVTYTNKDRWFEEPAE